MLLDHDLFIFIDILYRVFRVFLLFSPVTIFTLVKVEITAVIITSSVTVVIIFRNYFPTAQVVIGKIFILSLMLKYFFLIFNNFHTLF